MAEISPYISSTYNDKARDEKPFIFDRL